MPRSLLGFIALGAAAAYAAYKLETTTAAQVPIVGKALANGTPTEAVLAGAGVGWTLWELLGKK